MLIIVEEAILLSLTFKFLLFDEKDELLGELAQIYFKKRKKIQERPKSEGIKSRIYNEIKFTDIKGPGRENHLSLNLSKNELRPGFKIIRKPRFALLNRCIDNTPKNTKGNGFTHERIFSTNNNRIKNHSIEENSLILRSNEQNFINETQKRLKLT